MQLAATPFSDGSIRARGFRAARLVRRLPGRGRTGGVTMMFRKLTLITALAATLAFPAVALAAHGRPRRRRPWRRRPRRRLARRRRRWHGGGWQVAAVGRRRWRLAWRWLAWRWLAWRRRRATILGWPLVALRRWPVLAVVLRHLGLGLLTRHKSSGARARSARARGIRRPTKSLPDSSSVDSRPSSQLGRRRRRRRVRNSRPDFWRDIADALPPRNRKAERERFPW